MPEQTMLSYIRDSLNGGELPAGFHLPGETRPSFADGAADGIRRVHTAPRPLTEAERKAATAFMESAAAGDEEKARALLEDLLAQKKLSAYDCAQEFRRWARERTEPELRGRLHRVGLTLIRQCGVDEKEQVKTGLILLSLADECPEDERGDVRTLGLCDEFTFYVLPVIRTWPSANEELFRLAQRVHGWGRICLAGEILPENETIRRWFLTDAVHNTVHPAYSALDCCRKGNAPAALLGPLSPEEFRGIRDIVGGLLDEGPVKGVSLLEDAEAAMFVFLVRAKEFELSAEDAAVIRAVRGRFSGRKEIAALCGELLASYDGQKEDGPDGASESVPAPMSGNAPGLPREQTPPERAGSTPGPDRKPRFFDDDGSAVWLDEGLARNRQADASSGRPEDPGKQDTAGAESQRPFSPYDNRMDGKKPPYGPDEADNSSPPALEVTELLPPRTLDELMAGQPEEKKPRSGAGTMLAMAVILLAIGMGTHHSSTVICAFLFAGFAPVLWITDRIKKKKKKK